MSRSIGHVPPAPVDDDRVTGAQILVDFEGAGVDESVVRMVRHGLAAIADEVRELDNQFGYGGHTDAVRRDEVLALIDPKAAPR